MQSGIYVLKFSSGNFYIGKSEDIPTRWKQHVAAFTKSTHTSRMQNEYNLYGLPTAEVLVECHRDHIDLMEAIAIHENAGPKLLNGNAPKRVEDWECNILMKSADRIKQPTAMHLILLKEQELKAKRLEKKLNKLKNKGIEMPEDIANVVSNLHKELGKCEAELTRYKTLPLWKRIFSYNVSV